MLPDGFISLISVYRYQVGKEGINVHFFYGAASFFWKHANFYAHDDWQALLGVSARLFFQVCWLWACGHSMGYIIEIPL